ncbi:hypothetical protein Tco_1368538 [Tanacetum coccineum]
MVENPRFGDSKAANDYRSIEIRKVQTKASELRESEARSRRSEISLTNDDDNLGFYASYPNNDSTLPFRTLFPDFGRFIGFNIGKDKAIPKSTIDGLQSSLHKVEISYPKDNKDKSEQKRSKTDKKRKRQDKSEDGKPNQSKPDQPDTRKDSQ